MPSSVVTRVRINPAPGVPGRGSCELPVAPPGRVEPVADQGELMWRRQPGHRYPGGDGKREAGGAGDLIDGDARVDRADSHAVVRPAEVEYRQVGHYHAQLVEPGGGRAEAGRAVVADAADHVGPLGKHPARMPGHPVADRVVD